MGGSHHNEKDCPFNDEYGIGSINSNPPINLPPETNPTNPLWLNFMNAGLIMHCMTASQPQRQHPLNYFGSTKLLERGRERKKERDFGPLCMIFLSIWDPFDQSKC